MIWIGGLLLTAGYAVWFAGARGWLIEFGQVRFCRRRGPGRRRNP